MRIKKLLSLLIVAVLLASGVWVMAQEGEEMTPEQQKMMELMMKYGTPGEGHKLLEPLVGEWQAASRWRSSSGWPASCVAQACWYDESRWP